MIKFGLLLGILATLLAGCSSTKGSGNVIDDKRSVSGFSRITVGGSATVILVQDGSESLEISAEDNLLPFLTSEVRGDTLELGLQTGMSIQPSKEIVYRISVKDLRGFRLSGSGSVDLQNIDTDELTIEIGGSGKITATGRAAAQTITIAGQGDYLAEALESSSAVIDISGSGSALVYANQSLDVTITGSGNVDYLGEPAVKQNISGSGGVRKR